MSTLAAVFLKCFPYASDKTTAVFLYLIFLFLYHFSCINVTFYFLVHCNNSRFSKWRPSAILDIIFFAIFVENSNLPICTLTCKIWWRSDNRSYCASSIFKMATVLHIGFSYFRNICQKFKSKVTVKMRMLYCSKFNCYN